MTHPLILDAHGRGSAATLADLVAGAGGASPTATKDFLTIREMTREFGVTARALRFYEEKNLIAPERSGQDRLYSRRDRGRLRLVLMGKCVGFSLEEVKAMLDLYDLGDGGVTQMKVARGKYREQVARLRSQKRDIDTAINELERAITVIDQRLATKGTTPDGD
ncbi:MerR family transcriptional regulator [Phreatobacter stygius]|uniref:MerR family DNA-binding transcriptional regulator n=1 Tax=Phreatobacter stygius TaxID=1940610 RepID=A0A4D7B267_9HYPH|nr:MerR family DNA-binding transcriptional regulator [Phreatobacter stygius]QCI65415.1 MerR family DNA-binding transcriptional regulator [Phreatobacter stygius]